MKKFFRVSFVLLLGCLCLFSATACGNTGAQQEEPNVQERTVAPRTTTDGEETEIPECPDCPDETENPGCPECPRIPRCPKRPDSRGITRLPRMRMYGDGEDDEIHEGVPVPHQEEKDNAHGKHHHRMHKPPMHEEPAPEPQP